MTGGILSAGDRAGAAREPEPYAGIPFRPDLEGLRGVAVLFVVAYHAGVPGFSGGYIGVDVFFVLSGYLITRLLVAEFGGTGRIDMPRFYARRMRRLFPALYLVLFATVAGAWFVYSPAEQRSLSLSAIATAGYVSNFWFAHQATDYLAQEADTNPLLHTWSLAVEEQFYLAWPWLILVSLRLSRPGSRVPVLWVVTAVAAVSLALELVLTRAIQPWAFFVSPTRAWEFAAGGIAGLLPASPAYDRSRDAAAWVGLAAVSVAAMVYDESTAFPGAAALVPAIGTALVLRGSVSGRMAPSRWLRVGVLQWLGRLSYSWYLWHWPVIVIPLVALPDLGLPARLGLALGALALAHLTFHLIENPVRRGRLVPARRAALVIAGGLALSAAGVGFGAIWRGEAAAASRLPGQIRFAAAAADLPLIYRNGCSLPHLRVDIPDCSFGAVESARTIVLFGDSHAAQWFPALARIAETRRWRLTVFTKSECPVPEIDYVSAVLGRRYDECSAWRARAIERIRALHPLAVLMSSSYAYPVTDSEWSAGMKATLARLAAEGTRLVLIRDVPRPGFHVPTCLARANWPPGFERPAACSFPVADALNEDRFDAEHQAARTFAGQITIADLTDAICEPDTCRPEIASTVKYRDSNHLTATFVTQLSDVLQRYLP